MHDPRVGRFFAVDPLTSKYAFYSPYSFSGNEVISKGELEGLEPSDKIIVEHKLTRPVARFLEVGFNMDRGTINSTMHIPLEKMHGTGKYWIADGAVGEGGSANAITLGEQVVYANDIWPGETSNKYWLILISHEQTHREQIYDAGGWGIWYTQYLGDIMIRGYDGSLFEEQAYDTDEIMENFLNTSLGQDFLDELGDGTLTESEANIYGIKGIKIPRLKELKSTIEKSYKDTDNPSDELTKEYNDLINQIDNKVQEYEKEIKSIEELSSGGDE